MFRNPLLRPLCVMNIEVMRTVESVHVAAFRNSVALTLRARNASHICDLRGSNGVHRRMRRQCTVVASELAPGNEVNTPQPHTPDAARRARLSYEWRGHEIRYSVWGPVDGAPVLLVHGFGGSSGHWRRTVPALESTSELRVYAIDLLGFGASAKPSPDQVEYSLELWGEQIADFARRFADGSTGWSFVGNSIGSLACLIAAKDLGPQHIRALALMNSAGGLVSFRMDELAPWQRILLRVFNATLFNPVVGGFLFRTLRSRENLRGVLQNIYGSPDSVDDELVEIIATPAYDLGAQEVFLAVFNADAGPKPEPLLQELQWCPVLVCWGEQDTLTPLYTGMHPGARFADIHPRLSLRPIAQCGHCPFDDRPEEVNKELVPFLLNPTIIDGERPAKSLEDATV